MVSAMKLRKIPFPVSWVTKERPPPPPPPRGCDASRSPTPMRMGKSAATASSNWFRRRRKTWRSSDRKKRSQARVGPTRTGPAAGPAPAAGDSIAVASAIDVKPLSGQPDEELLQAGGHDAQPPDPDTGVDQARTDPFGLEVTELGRDLMRP